MYYLISTTHNIHTSTYNKYTYDIIGNMEVHEWTGHKGIFKEYLLFSNQDFKFD